MRIVVTGASGNLGTSLLRALAEDAAVDSILGIARRRPDWQPPKVEWATADVVVDELEPLFDGADVVVHLAWAIQPSRDPQLLRDTNVWGSQRVFEATARAGAGKLVHASSVGAYSRDDANRTPRDESWPTEGIASSFYSAHKAEVETLLDRFEQQRPEVAVARIRPALIFKGEAGSEIRRLFAGPFVPARLAEPGRLPVVPWIRGVTAQAVHSADVAEGFRLAALGDAGGAFNLAAEPVLDGAALGEILDARVVELPFAAVRTLAELSWRLRLQPTPPGWADMARAVPTMRTDRAREELGWSPRMSAGEAIVELLAGFAAQSGVETPPLDPDSGGPARSGEIASGIGARH